MPVSPKRKRKVKTNNPFNHCEHSPKAKVIKKGRVVCRYGCKR